MLFKTRLIFPRVNGPTVLTIVPTSKFIPPPWCTCRRQGGRMLEESFSWLFMLQKKCYLRVFSVNKIVISICICGFKVCVVISDSWVGTTVSGVYEYESTVLAYGKVQGTKRGLRPGRNWIGKILDLMIEVRYKMHFLLSLSLKFSTCSCLKLDQPLTFGL